MNGAIVTGFLLDQALGDPQRLPHPVQFLGQAIALLEQRWNRGSALARKTKGILMAIIITGASYALPWLALRLLHGFPEVRFVLETALIAFALAGKSLLDAGRSVIMPLENAQIDEARKALAGFVSRDTQELSEGEVARGTVETLAENFVDGILSPLFFAALGGAPLIWAFKAVSTLDSMVGYRNARFQDFGWFSARADDWANYVPARLSVLLLGLAGGILRLDVHRALKIWRRDAHSHPSPNGGNPESMVAGLLGVQLGGMNVYEGKPTFRPTLGDAVVPLRAKQVRQTITLVRLTSWLALVLMLALEVMGWLFRGL